MERMKFNHEISLTDIMPIGIRYYFDFENGYRASVIKTLYSQGGDQGLWELAVFWEDKIYYEHPVLNGDVKGYLSDYEVAELLYQIKNPNLS